MGVPIRRDGVRGTPEHWIGTDIGHNIDPDDYERVMATLAGVGSGEPIQTRFRVHTADGGYHWVDGHAKPHVDAEGNTNGLIAALRIIDEQVEAEQKLDRLARFDALTGLPNRAEAISRLDAALEEPRTPGSCVGILFCDVDHFKTINDTLGHAAGDAVLSTLAKRIRQGVRQGDTVGRMGGDGSWSCCPACAASMTRPGSPRKSVAAQRNPFTTPVRPSRRRSASGPPSQAPANRPAW